MSEHPVEKIARVLLDTADFDDLGWNNLRATACALLPLISEAWTQGATAMSQSYRDAPWIARNNPYRPAAFTEACQPTGCSCMGHRFPGVQHMTPCCDVPHIAERDD